MNYKNYGQVILSQMGIICRPFTKLVATENNEILLFESDSFDLENPKRFNKSNLLPQHRHIVQGQIPYKDAHSWIHLTEKYQRKVFGQHGAKSKVSPQICFASKELIAYEVGLNLPIKKRSLQEMMEKVCFEKEKCRAIIEQREVYITKNVEKLEEWKAELNSKIAKKKADAQATKDRKERVFEEVRRHFGFKIDSRDERFTAMLAKKEKENKRKEKDAKRKEMEERKIVKLIQQSENV